MSKSINFKSINFSNLGNLVLGVAGSVAIFVLAIDHGVTGITIAGAIGAAGAMGKAICSAISEYQYPKGTSVGS